MFGNNRINDLERRLSRCEHSNSTRMVNVNVTEQRATTDEAIRLADEMRDKTLKNIVFSGITKGNTFNYAFYIVEEACCPCTKFILAAVINNKRYLVESFIENLCDLNLIKTQKPDGTTEFRPEHEIPELINLRIKMLGELLAKAMYDSNPEEFIKIHSNMIGKNEHNRIR